MALPATLLTLPTPFKSLKGRKVPWTSTQCEALSKSLLEQLPSNFMEVLDGWEGGPLLSVPADGEPIMLSDLRKKTTCG